MKVSLSQKSIMTTCLLLAAAGAPAIAGENGTSRVDVETGIAIFEAATNVPGVEVKGKSVALRAHVGLSHNDGRLVLEEIEATLPVKSLSTGMGVRDEHMRKYIFTTAEGQLPDLRFTAGSSVCEANGAAQQFTCRIAGTLAIRGVARPFTISLNVKEQSGPVPVFRATGDAPLKLSSFGITPPTQFGVKTSDEVKLHLEFSARQKQMLTSQAGGVR